MTYAYNSTDSLLPEEAKADIVIQTSIKSMEKHGEFWAFDERIMSRCDVDMFDYAYWQSRKAVTGQAQGRGITWFIKYNEHDLVLRHFYRGGLIGRFIDDDYFYTNRKNCRAAREFYLLHDMYKLGLPVPRPIAFCVHRKGLLYTNDLILEKIPNTLSLVKRLETEVLTDACWFEIGKTIRQFHDLGFNHRDLNSHNILVNDDGQVWLIDFDRGTKRDKNGSWKNKNLNRLKRSLCKENLRLEAFEWCETKWQTLLAGYHTKSANC